MHSSDKAHTCAVLTCGYTRMACQGHVVCDTHAQCLVCQHMACQGQVACVPGRGQEGQLRTVTGPVLSNTVSMLNTACFQALSREVKLLNGVARPMKQIQVKLVWECQISSVPFILSIRNLQYVNNADTPETE